MAIEIGSSSPGQPVAAFQFIELYGTEQKCEVALENRPALA